MANVMKWVADSDAERIMVGAGVKWEIKTVLLSKLDLPRSMSLQPRPERPLDPDVVEDLVCKLDGTDPWCKRLVVIILPDGTAIVCGGLHRAHALLDLTHPPKFVEVYVLLTSDTLLIDKVRDKLNMLHGAPESKAAILAKAKYRVRKYSISDTAGLEAVAKEFNLKLSLLKTAIETDRVAEIVVARSPGLRHLLQAHYLVLKKLSDNHRVLGEAAIVANRYKMTKDELVDFVQKVRAETGGEDARLLVITTEVANRKAAAAAAATEPPRPADKRATYNLVMMPLKNALTQFKRFAPKKPENIQITSSQDRANFEATAAPLVKWLTAMLKQISSKGK